MDKDRFRKDLGDLIDGYQEIAKRLGLIPESGIIQGGSIDEQVAEGLDEIENDLSKGRRLRSVKPSKNKPRKTS